MIQGDNQCRAYGRSKFRLVKSELHAMSLEEYFESIQPYSDIERAELLLKYLSTQMSGMTRRQIQVMRERLLLHEVNAWRTTLLEIIDGNLALRDIVGDRR